MHPGSLRCSCLEAALPRGPVTALSGALSLLLRDEWDYDQVVKRISIQDLKSGLSAVIAEAENGQTVLVTRHNRAVARLSPVSPGRGQGDGMPLGATALTPLLRKATGGRYLRVLKDDRSAER